MSTKVKTAVFSILLSILPSLAGCTGSEIVGAYMALVIAKPLLDSYEPSSSSSSASTSDTKQYSRPIRRSTAKRTAKVPTVTKRSAPNKNDYRTEEIIAAYKNLNWEKCLRLAASQIHSAKMSHSDKCTSKILAGAIHYQMGDTDAARMYFDSSCRFEDCRIHELLSPSVKKFYQSVNP
ncbi:hypothetical protein STSP2_01872 [Anaerohalosphaera lusitana]|uniref:Lipoprotein n=1 Tax=Anaerohalosphaera lusitana TaxID=1936003 RepID=A0A1U9NM82_9BACT|nr:hypothetical protein [Anaerohalosphaera lusitana]AQT68700.1 hypothetical protein STSP2_01872 [Anaerohalosphaera lusitana]